MTVTLLTGPGRVAQFLWGPNQQNTLTFGYPTALDEARFWRAQRVGGEQLIVNNLAESWTAARDYFMVVKARWIGLPFWSGHGGFQAFLDWGSNGNPFTLVPDAVQAPLFVLSGCLLVDPFERVTPRLEADGSQMIELTIRSPTFDLGLAWR